MTLQTLKLYYTVVLQYTDPTLWRHTWTAIQQFCRKQPRIRRNPLQTAMHGGGALSRTVSLCSSSASSASSAAAAIQPTNALVKKQTSLDPSLVPGQPLGTLGMYVTTYDAYTLTDGPSIFLTADVDKVGLFCVQQANIPDVVMQLLMDKIATNNAVLEQITALERELDELKTALESSAAGGMQRKGHQDARKLAREDTVESGSEWNSLNDKLGELRKQIKPVALNDMFVPNKPKHLDKWTGNPGCVHPLFPTSTCEEDEDDDEEDDEEDDDEDDNNEDDKDKGEEEEGCLPSKGGLQGTVGSLFLSNPTHSPTAAADKKEPKPFQKKDDNPSKRGVQKPANQDHPSEWLPRVSSRPFTSHVTEASVCQIMELEQVSSMWKVLLLMGIGALSAQTAQHTRYIEIMKQLIDQQHLYLILATDDYLYGTNYQFCHGLVSKDMDMTPEKIIQSIGRIGRGHMQQSYTVRFRNRTAIHTLFSTTFAQDTPSFEANTMNRLFG